MRTRWTRAMAAGAALLTMGLFAAPSVEITAVQQQYPWTNTVDITYEVRGVTNMEYFVRFTPTTSDDDPILNVEGEASIQVALESNGVFTAQWYPQTNLQYTACKMTPAIFRGGSGGGRDYLVIDLETWEVTYEPMATQEASNQRYNTDEYKTKKLVLRKVPADTYWIGGPKTNTVYHMVNSEHQVKMPKDYYIGVFQLTVAQYNRLNGTANPGASTVSLSGSTATWNTIRGSALNAAKPSKGILYTLNTRCGTAARGNFDLPTCAMWEVAARAGSRKEFLSGDTATDLYKYAFYGHKYDKTFTGAVGLLLPNDWGLYDVIGTRWEFTRDYYDTADMKTWKEDGLTPHTSGGDNSRIFGKGSDYGDGDERSSFQAGIAITKSASNGWIGWRLAFIPD